MLKLDNGTFQLGIKKIYNDYKIKKKIIIRKILFVPIEKIKKHYKETHYLI